MGWRDIRHFFGNCYFYGLSGFVWPGFVRSAGTDKEIGIRKVLGASVSGIILMFSRQLVKLVQIAGLIAAPLAWIALENWLANFAYRTELGIGVLLTAIVITAVIVIFTVSFQSVKAAFSDPVKALRYE